MEGAVVHMHYGPWARGWVSAGGGGELVLEEHWGGVWIVVVGGVRVVVRVWVEEGSGRGGLDGCEGGRQGTDGRGGG